MVDVGAFLGPRLMFESPGMVGLRFLEGGLGSVGFCRISLLPWLD